MNAPENQRRVLYVVSEPWYFANHRLDHAKGLIAAGFDVHVATRPGDRFDEIADAGCVMHELDMSRGSSGFVSLCREILALRRLVGRCRPSIVHGVALKPVALTIPLLLMLGRPSLVLSVNGLGLSATEKSTRLALVRRVLRVIGRLPRVELLFQTESDRRAIAGGTLMGVLIPGVGVDLDEFAPCADLAPGPPFRVAYLGRAVRSKGLNDLAAAAHDPRLAELGIEIHAYCSHDPTSPGSLTASELDAVASAPSLTVHEPTRDPAGVLAGSHAAVLPSLAGEGVSKFVLEAFASGTPVLLTRESGSAEVVESGTTGLTFAAADGGSLVDALVEFASWSAQKHDEVSTACRTLAEAEYGTDVIVPAIVDLPESLVTKTTT